MKSYFLLSGLVVFLLLGCTKESSDKTKTNPVKSDANSENSGGVDGGGGKSIVCRNEAGDIKTAEVLDLYEGRVMYGKNIPESSIPMDEQIEAAIARIPMSSRGFIQGFVLMVKENMRLTPAGAQLLPIDDSFEVIVPKGCAAEQVANYYSDNLVIISGDIWAALTETSKAALILHEAVYATNRLVGAKNSRQSRHIVAHIFDPSTKWVDVKDGVPTDAMFCGVPGGGGAMWVFKDPSGAWVMQFNAIGDGFTMSKKTIEFSGSDFDLNEMMEVPVSKGVDRIGEYNSLLGYVNSDFEDDDFVVITRQWEAPKNSEGVVVDGYQFPRYYFEWHSATFPNTSTPKRLIVCLKTKP